MSDTGSTVPGGTQQGTMKTASKGPLALLALLGILLVFSFVTTSAVLHMLFSSDRASAVAQRQELDSLLSGTAAKTLEQRAAAISTQQQLSSSADRAIPDGRIAQEAPSKRSGMERARQEQPRKNSEEHERIQGEEDDHEQQGEEGPREEEEEPEEQEGVYEEREQDHRKPAAKGRAGKKGKKPSRAAAGHQGTDEAADLLGGSGTGRDVSFNIDPMNVAAFEGAEEDKEMALIYEIVKLAEQKEAQHKQERQQQLSHEAAAMGMTTDQYLAHQQAVGSMSSNIFDTPCQSVKDCANSCLEGCQHQRISEQCRSECRPRCQSQCGASSWSPSSAKKGGKGHKGGGGGWGGASAECLGQCDRGCRRECLAEKAEQLERMQIECTSTTDRICALECRELREADVCLAGCLARGQAECRKQYEGDCEAGCGKHLCVEGRCRCPVYFSGDPMCSSVMQIHHMMPEGLKHCSTPYTDDRFKKNSGGNFSVLDYRSRVSPAMLKIHHDNVAMTGARIQPEPDLRDLADFSTCAVIGSSSSLKGARMGAEIDSHTAVIRFNDAPTKSFQADVGSKTTLRLQNVIYCGFHEYSNEICLHYTGFKGNYCPAQRQKKFKCNYVWLSNRLLSYVQNFFNRNIFTGVAATKDTSAGFFGILLALHLCGKVDIYGFTQRSNHYFNKQMNSRRSFGDKHAWALERQCSNLFSNLPAVSSHA